MNDDCIIKAYVYKKAGFNKLSYSYKKPLYNSSTSLLHKLATFVTHINSFHKYGTKQ